MTKQQYYTYLTEEGGCIIITTKLAGVNFSSKKIRLIADEGYVLTQDNKHFYNEKWVLEDEVSLWKEVLQDKVI